VRQPAVRFASGLFVTVALELYAIHVNGRWSYGPLMPLFPILRIGLAPVEQWLAIPAALLLLMDRFFRGTPDVERNMR
jgi:hypothetical protein